MDKVYCLFTDYDCEENHLFLLPPGTQEMVGGVIGMGFIASFKTMDRSTLEVEDIIPFIERRIIKEISTDEQVIKNEYMEYKSFSETINTHRMSGYFPNYQNFECFREEYLDRVKINKKMNKEVKAVIRMING
jgi:hypothetical protein